MHIKPIDDQLCRRISRLLVSWLLRYHAVKELTSTIGHFGLLWWQMRFISLFLLSSQPGNIKVLLALIHLLVAMEIRSFAYFSNHGMVLIKSFFSCKSTRVACKFVWVAHAPLSLLVFRGHARVQVALPTLTVVIVVEALIESGRYNTNLNTIIVCACIHSFAHHMWKDSCHVSNPIYFFIIFGRDTLFLNSNLSDSSWLLRRAIPCWRFLYQIGAI